MRCIVGGLFAGTTFVLVACGGPPSSPFLDGADDVAPARWDTDIERLVGGQATCLQRQGDQAYGWAPRPNDQIARDIVQTTASYADAVTIEEATVWVDYAVQHCPYLTSPEVKRQIDEGT